MKVGQPFKSNSSRAKKDRVMSVMTQARFRHLPVITKGRLAGIVSIGDVVKLKIEQAERDAASLRDYIASA